MLVKLILLSRSQDWLLLDTPGISETRRDLKITWEGVPRE